MFRYARDHYSANRNSGARNFKFWARDVRKPVNCLKPQETKHKIDSRSSRRWPPISRAQAKSCWARKTNSCSNHPRSNNILDFCAQGVGVDPFCSILMLRDKKCRETIFASQLSRNYPHRGGDIGRGIQALSCGREIIRETAF